MFVTFLGDSLGGSRMLEYSRHGRKLQLALPTEGFWHCRVQAMVGPAVVEFVKVALAKEARKRFVDGTHMLAVFEQVCPMLW